MMFGFEKKAMSVCYFLSVVELERHKPQEVLVTMSATWKKLLCKMESWLTTACRKDGR